MRAQVSDRLPLSFETCQTIQQSLPPHLLFKCEALTLLYPLPFPLLRFVALPSLNRFLFGQSHCIVPSGHLASRHWVLCVRLGRLSTKTYKVRSPMPTDLVNLNLYTSGRSTLKNTHSQITKAMPPQEVPGVSTSAAMPTRTKDRPVGGCNLCISKCAHPWSVVLSSRQWVALWGCDSFHTGGIEFKAYYAFCASVRS